MQYVIFYEKSRVVLEQTHNLLLLPQPKQKGWVVAQPFLFCIISLCMLAKCLQNAFC